MMNWIYLKSDSIIDILSLSVALDNATQKWNIVRTTGVSQYLSCHPGVSSIGFPSPDDNVVTINLMEDGSFYDKVVHILQSINEDPQEDLMDFEPHYDVEHPNILERIRNEKYAVLLLTMYGDRPLDLFFIDEACRQISNAGFKMASLGTMIIPCIRGTYDLRGLLNGSETLAALEHAPFVISNDPHIIEYCCVRNIKAFHLEQNETSLSCNKFPMFSPNHLANLILKHYHNE